MTVDLRRWLAMGLLTGGAMVATACGTTKALSSQGSAAAKSAPACQSDQIAVVPMSALVGAGESAQQLGFVNVSTSSCTLKGSPTVSLLNDAGTQVVVATPTPPADAPTSSVTLLPGSAATTLVQGSDGNVANLPCATYPWFVVTPPGLTDATPPGSSLSTKVAVGLPISTTGFGVCGTPSVSPVRPAGTVRTG